MPWIHSCHYLFNAIVDKLTTVCSRLQWPLGDTKTPFNLTPWISLERMLSLTLVSQHKLGWHVWIFYLGHRCFSLRYLNVRHSRKGIFASYFGIVGEKKINESCLCALLTLSAHTSPLLQFSSIFKRIPAIQCIPYLIFYLPLLQIIVFIHTRIYSTNLSIRHILFGVKFDLIPISG